MRKRRKPAKNRARRIIARWVLLMLVTAAALSPLHLGNDFLRSSDFDTVEVGRKDSVCAIAARYTEKTEDAKELAEAIIEVNGLSADGALRVGQRLRIPVLKERLPKVAENQTTKNL